MENIALDNYKNGCNCAQAILKTFAAELELNEETAMKMAVGLGSGMYTGETCGVVSAAFIALGLKHGSMDKSKAKEVLQMIKQYEKEFKEKNSSLNCKELKVVHKKDCKELVKDSAKILDSLLK